MPSPFPGMDPFVEHPDFFRDLHGRLHVYMSEALQSALPAPYYAVVSERLWVESSARYVEPDTDIIRGGAKIAEPYAGGVALATRTQPAVFEVTDDERTESYVEIRTRLADGGERMVTAIEALSLSNKTPGEKSRELYLEKQREILNSSTHLIEIDLLRGGQPATPIPSERLRQKLGPFDYHVSVHRFDQPGRFFICPWTLEAVLPEIAVPLLPGDGEVALDLQAVFRRCYDSGPYARRVPYDLARLVPPLPEARLQWVRQVLDTSRAPAQTPDARKP